MTSSIQALSGELAAAVRALAPSSVGVTAARRGTISGLVWSSDGLVVTSSALLDDDEPGAVILHDGSSHAPKLVGRDPATDVALLRIDAALTPPAWSDPAELALGQLVLGLGSAGGQQRVSFGVLGALGPSFQTHGGSSIERLISADFEPRAGYSGSLLADVGGRAIGMNTTALVRRGGITLPRATLERVVTALGSHGRIRRTLLGIGSYPARLPDALAKTAGQSGAIIVVSLQPGGPAELAGIGLGDAILSVAERPTPTFRDLLGVLAEDRVGQEVPVRLLRAGKLETAHVKLAQRN